MGKLIQFLSAWALVMPLVAGGQVLEARGDSVDPGGLGRLWLEWSGVPEGPAWLEVEAPEELVFLELPSMGEGRRGEARWRSSWSIRLRGRERRNWSCRFGAGSGVCPRGGECLDPRAGGRGVRYS